MAKRKLTPEQKANVCECTRYKINPKTGKLELVESYKFIDEPTVNVDGTTSLKIRKFDVVKKKIKKTSSKKK